MAIVTTGGVEVVDEALDGLAKTINAHVGLARLAAQTWMEHALAAGAALLEAWDEIPRGEWHRWVETNLTIDLRQARDYMRAAVYRDKLVGSGARTLPDVRAVLRGLPALAQKGRTPSISIEIRSAINRRREAGESWTSIGRSFGVEGRVARSWVDPVYARSREKSHRATDRARRQRQRDTADLRKQRARDEAVRAVGGKGSKAYAELRRVALFLDAALSDVSGEERDAMRSALMYVHKAEDDIVRALRLERAR